MNDILHIVPWWAWFLFGMLAGMAILNIFYAMQKDGTIHVEQRPDNEADLALFEFDISPKQIPRMKQVVFKVVVDPPKTDS